MGEYAVIPNITDNSLRPETKSDDEVLEGVCDTSSSQEHVSSGTGFMSSFFTMRTLFIVAIVVGVLLLVYIIYTYFTIKKDPNSAKKSTVKHTEIPNRQVSKDEIDIAELKALREAAQRRKEQKNGSQVDEKTRIEMEQAEIDRKAYMDYMQAQQQAQKDNIHVEQTKQVDVCDGATEAQSLEVLPDNIDTSVLEQQSDNKIASEFVIFTGIVKKEEPQENRVEILNDDDDVPSVPSVPSGPSVEEPVQVVEEEVVDNIVGVESDDEENEDDRLLQSKTLTTNGLDDVAELINSI
jgi:uncharacterized membrane protein